jgi:hypothetical protein
MAKRIKVADLPDFDAAPYLDSEEAVTEMWIKGVSIEILPQGQKLLANRLGVPFSYLNRCSPELQRTNLQYWLEQERKVRENLFLRFNREKQIRACFSNRYTAIDNREILSKMLTIGFLLSHFVGSYLWPKVLCGCL